MTQNETELHKEVVSHKERRRWVCFIYSSCVYALRLAGESRKTKQVLFPQKEEAPKLRGPPALVST